MPLHTYDTFDGIAGDLTGHVGQTGAAWSRHPAYADVPANQTAWRLSGAGRAYTSAGGYSKCIYLASGVPAAAEFDIRTGVRLLTTDQNGYYGVCFRLNATADTCWRLVYETYQTPFRWSLQVVSAGELTRVQDYNETPANGSDRAIVIRVRNTGVTVNIDGTDRLAGTDALATGGDRIGLFGTGANSSTSTTGIHFDVLAVGPAGFTLPAYAVTGPDGGPPDFDSTTFTVALAPGVNPGTLVVTPAVAGITGTFTPTTVSLTDAGRSATFVFRPTATGTATLSFTNGSGLEDEPARTYAAAYTGPSREAFWASRLPYVNGVLRPYVVGTSYWLDGDDHYDVPECGRKMYEYAIRKSLPHADYYLGMIEAGIVRFRDRALIANGSVSGYHRFLSGIARHYYHTSAAADLTAADLMMPTTTWTGAATWAGYSTLASYQKYSAFLSVTRETALDLATAIDKRWMGRDDAKFADIEDAATTSILGYVDKWTIPAATKPYGYWCKPFMGALCMRSLIMYWDRYRSSTDPAKVSRVASIPAAIKAFCAYIWSDCRIPPGTVEEGWDKGAIRYRDLALTHPRFAPITGNAITAVINARSVVRGPASLSTVDGFYVESGFEIEDPVSLHRISGYVGATREITIDSDGPVGFDMTTAMTFKIRSDGYEVVNNGPAQAINQMIFPVFAWAYWHERRVLGNFEASKHFRAEAFEIFDGAAQAWGDSYAQKEWNQSAFWTTDGLTWIDRGDVEWAAPTTFSLQAPANGAAGAHSVKSGAFRLSIPYGQALAAPKDVTVAEAGPGAGTFTSPGPILQPDRRESVFAYTPALADDATTVPVSATATGLTAPAAVGYAVGTQSGGGNTRCLLINSAAGGILMIGRP